MDRSQLAARGFLSGFALKLAAVFFMVIDHATEATFQLWIPFLFRRGMNAAQMMMFKIFLRGLGRISFPLFVFLLVEGFFHTRDVKKYALSLFIFSLLSECPFDLAVFRRTLEFSYQNVFFTLFLGILTLWGLEKYKGRKTIRFLICGGSLLLAELAGIDYGPHGIALILIMYFYRDQGVKRFIASALVYFALYCGDTIYALMKGQIKGDLITEKLYLYSGFFLFVMALPAFLLIHFYNGKRGPAWNKYIFYAFYPAHLLLLAWIAGHFA
ncbi:MAG: conjugal transfer protein TraX [Fusobacteriaceae bacterium]|jgi:hypothetical protein|nr:conjugal transfer protein TraX [Fusobacteriaceae bacterium]